MHSKCSTCDSIQVQQWATQTNENEMRAYRSAHRALIAVVPSPQEAVSAECVATWSSYRLVQQLQTQYTLKFVHPLRDSWPVQKLGRW